jgi:hypothetical protein
MLHCILRSFKLSKLSSLPDIKGIVDALVPYSERHFQRVEDAVQRTYYIDFVLHSTSAVGEDGDEDDGQGYAPLPFVVGVNRKALTNVSERDVEEDADEKTPSEDGGDMDDAGDGEVEMAGWGDWGGQEAGDGGDDDVESESEAVDSHKPSKSVGKDVQKRQNRAEEAKAKTPAKNKRNRGSVPGEIAGGLENVTPAPNKKASAVAKTTGKKKKAEAAEDDDDGAVDATPARPTQPAAKTTGKKKKPAQENDADIAKRRKSLESAEVKGTPPVAKRLRSKT